MKPKIHAAFIIHKVHKTDFFAATTRDDGRKVGLPGGKVNDGEAPRDAAIREAAEEGWEVSGVFPRPYKIAPVDGKLVAWYGAIDAKKLKSFKEKDPCTMQGSISLVGI